MWQDHVESRLFSHILVSNDRMQLTAGLARMAKNGFPLAAAML